MILLLVLHAINAVFSAVITSQVHEAMKKQETIPFLVQLKPADVQIMSFASSRMVSVAEIDHHAEALVSQLNRHAQRTNKEIQSLLDLKVEQGLIPPYRFYSISNTFAVEGSAALIEELSKYALVEEISSNFAILKASEFQTVMSDSVKWTGKEAHWSLNYIHASKLSSHIYEAARNLRYANADTGVQFDHPALAENYMGLKETGEIDHNYSWWDASTGEHQSSHPCKPGSTVPCDDHGHGSHTTGTAVGGLNLGVSPTTKWMACKNMYNNVGSPESYLGCLQFFLAPTDLNGEHPRASLRPHVIGNSYGCPPEEGCSLTTFKYALKAMKAAGIFMSISAGNDGTKGCGSVDMPPAIDPNSFSVAASDYQSNTRAYFSSLGPIKDSDKNAIDITAPGVNITSSVRNGGYASFQGTSMASPHVAGAVLLVTAACPHLARQVDHITRILHLSATPIYSQLSCGGNLNNAVPNNEFGYGMLNVARAIKLCNALF